jgi:predicted nuclease of predicted toxin-antitoxin system
MNFQTSQEAGLENLPDNEVLSLAAREGRILVTHDRRTMPGHFAKFLIIQTSPGVFLVPKRRSVRTIIEELILIWYASESEDYVNQILTLPL